MEKISIDFKGAYKNKIFAHVVIVGAGGTGGLVIQQVSQLFNIFDVFGKMVIADYDHFEEKNKANQLCLDKDIGKNKAEVLAKRYRAAYQVDITTFSTRYVENVETLENLFNTYYSGMDYKTEYLPILISCVDNNFTRQVFHEFFQKEKNLLYLDVGNESVALGKGPKDQWTNEELDSYNRSGYSGQLVCGLKLNGNVICDPIAEVFPDILEDKDEIKPSELSCQQLAASDPQRLITNRYSAMAVNTILNEIFETGCLSTHKIFYHSRKGYMRSENIIQKED